MIVKKKRLHNLAINVLILIITVVICLIVGEIGIRLLFSDEYTPGLWPKENAQYVSGLKKNVYVNVSNLTRSTSEFSYTINTNYLGFRDFHELDKKEGTTRIVGIGASSMFGNTVEVNETYLSKLGDKLNAEVINLGLGGNGFDEINYILTEYGLAYHPDLVIMEVELGNFYSAYLFEKRTGDKNRESLFSWVYHNSKLINYVYWKTKTTSLGYKTINFLKLNRHGQDSNAFDLSFLRHENTSDIYNSKKNAIRNLKEIKETLEKEKVPLLVIYIPPSYQISPQKFDLIVSELGIDGGNIDVSAAEYFYQVATDKSGIMFFDPTVDLTNHPESGNLDWKYDGHFNKRGNEIYASLLAEFITKNNILKAKQ